MEKRDAIKIARRKNSLFSFLFLCLERETGKNCVGNVVISFNFHLFKNYLFTSFTISFICKKTLCFVCVFFFLPFGVHCIRDMLMHTIFVQTPFIYWHSLSMFNYCHNYANQINTRNGKKHLKSWRDTVHIPNKNKQVCDNSNQYTHTHKINTQNSVDKKKHNLRQWTSEWGWERETERDRNQGNWTNMLSGMCKSKTEVMTKRKTKFK